MVKPYTAMTRFLELDNAIVSVGEEIVIYLLTWLPKLGNDISSALDIMVIPP
jgi:hypothetical protein